MTTDSMELDDTVLCVSCLRPLVRIRFTLKGHAAEERACGPCDQRALYVDGVPVTKADLLAGVLFD